MKLTIKDRIQMSVILPKTGSIVDLMLIKEIVNKISLSSEEIDSLGVTSDGGNVSWKKDKTIDINFISPEIKLLKDAVKKMDDERLINLDNLDLCVKINNL